MLSSPVEEIKDRLDIVEVVGGYLKLQKAGANHRALCPFHSEKGPSFFVSPARQMWHCFGCSLGGDIFSFVMQIEGIEFGDALRLLAQKAGIELSVRDPSYRRLQTERTRIYELLELATKFFEKQLFSSQTGAAVTQYLHNRGVSQESMEKWMIGYAPDSARGLMEFLQQSGYRTDEIGKAGLHVRSEGRLYDRFRGRIMFPIFDLNSQIIGFGGRIFGKKEENPPDGGLAKYINTPGTVVYDKSRVLYGLDKAKLAVRKQNSCVLVEGYMDAILVSQAGCDNVVATSGTALTPSHLRILKRYTQNLSLAFDMDIAGNTATKRGIDLAVSEGFALNIVTLPADKDPADIVQESSDSWNDMVTKASSIFDFYFTTTLARFDKSTSEGKKGIANILLPVIKKIPNKIEQSHWVQKIAEEFGTKEEHIYEELNKLGGNMQESQTLSSKPSVPSGEPKTRRDLVEERALLLMFRNLQNLQAMTSEDLKHFSVAMQEILEGMRKATTQDAEGWKEIFPPETIELLQRVSLQADIEEEGEEVDLEAEFRSCIDALQALYAKERLDDIAKGIKKAEQEEDLQKVHILLEEFYDVTRNLNSH
ncbi:DNA primase [Patescibacteria group bacterium]|nr:DNA primase [Patescibacteria group bacterium]